MYFFNYMEAKIYGQKDSDLDGSAFLNFIFEHKPRSSYK